jgi:aryl-alcohol dehydrogenase-like predicted oxidoreductase
MVMEALAISDRYSLVRFVSEQPPYNLLDRRIENELVPLARRHGLALLPWSPLAGGILAGRYSDVDSAPPGSKLERFGKQSMFGERVTRRGVAVATAVGEVAREQGLTTSQLALLWCKDQPGITAPIFGPRTVDHLRDALGVLERTLSPEVARQLDALNGPGNAVSDFHNSNDWMKARVTDPREAG